MKNPNPEPSSSGTLELLDLIRPYLEGDVRPEEARLIEARIQGDPEFAKQVEKRRALLDALGKAYRTRGLSPEFEGKAQKKLAQTASQPVLTVQTEEFVGAAAGGGEPEGALQRLGAAPWWAISVAFHLLAILLVSLITMTIGEEGKGEAIIVTNLERAPSLDPLKEEKKKPDLRDVLDSKVDVPATDPTSNETSNIVVPPDILAKAELSDHFETVNPDRPDTHSAFGNPDARMFHSVTGNDEPEGGGGTGGVSLMDDMIGVGGPGSPGTGGGWGGGNGTGTGVGSGSGHGSFGNRNGGGRRLCVMKYGGSKATESSVDAALAWLARHQEKDGFWRTEKYLDNPNYRYGGSKGMSRLYDPGMTGFAALAFLGAGHSLRVGKYKENVRQAIKWLISQQGADGDFTSKVKPCPDAVTYYCHCIATLACAEALGMNGGKDWGGADASFGEQTKGLGLKEAVERGVKLILEWQAKNPTGGWTYYAPYVVCDVTVSGWAVMALKSAKVAGIVIPADSFKKASDAVAKCTVIDKNKGDYGMAHTGYLSSGSHQFNSKGYAITAAAMVIQEFVGADRQEAGIDAAAAFVTQPDALPQWIFKPQDPSTDHQNLYFWYYGTLGCFQKGGDTWKLWNEKLKAALVPNLKKGGALDGSPQDVDGSWDPDDVWGAWGGRVYSTCLGCLCLEVYYRYLPLYR
ncbi:MAG: terpene cyclase/mutase family protein [Planctomycetes bacterium]|nr:terpene cyclase/mutase family protein [Planctomycetota bacterium]